MNIYQKIVKQIIGEEVKTRKGVNKVKREAAKKYKISFPSNIRLLKAYHRLVENKKISPSKSLEKILTKKPIRSLSGVAVVSVLTKPYFCPGECIFCPKERGMPQSYLRGEPAAERAKKLKFNPYTQTQKRINSLKLQGHPVDKIEIRIIGGSFSSYPRDYKIWFLTNLFAAANKRKELGLVQTKDLEKEQKINQTADRRIVGISIETRPDLISKKEIELMRSLGVTMVELGVQTVFDDILKKCRRGHGVAESIKATKLLKDSGFKVLYQMMPNLPGSNLKKDLKAFSTLFKDPRFRPDWLKIYPCVVCKGSPLYNLWKEGKFKPYSPKELIKLLIKIKRNLPYWVRVARLFRDIPAPKIEAGCKISNLREVVQKEMEKKNLKCRCIRCREVKGEFDPQENIHLFKEEYSASKGKEIFLSLENKERTKLLAFLRLRIPHQPFISALKNSAIVRELHTYGKMIPLNQKRAAPQHRGLGKKLMAQAERITYSKLKLPRISVISGIGVREYYKKLGYHLKGEYMIKDLTNPQNFISKQNKLNYQIP